MAKLSTLCTANAVALQAALEYCHEHGIGSFRINSQILPIKTHHEWGYDLNELPAAPEIVRQFEACREFARQHQIRTGFHPDPFVVLNSPHEDVVDRSIKELDYQAEVAEWVAADVLNIHAGGAYGDRTAALERLQRNLDRLAPRVRERLTLENDDRSYAPADLLPLCQRTGVPLVYDVHHHRCHPDELTIEAATQAALGTWNREPLFHLSSPREGWEGPRPKRHHDFIDIRDFPACWDDLEVTIEVEAKAKELAVQKLMKQLRERWFVYILRCADGSLYTGITNHPDRRLQQHNAGTASRYTRSRLPVEKVYQEEQRHQIMALKRELAIKAMSRPAKETLISTAGTSVQKGH